MMTISFIFFDVGGVLLTNGWDTAGREQTAAQFGLEFDEFQTRHEQLFEPLERAEITLAEYLDAVIFHRPRPFNREEFVHAMRSHSRAHPSSLEVLAKLARGGKYRLGTLNNESLDLNLHRISQFGLRQYCGTFFSSCFLGVRKPGRRIYDMALWVAQVAPEHSLFIDDREENVEGARAVGMSAAHLRDPADLEGLLRSHGIEL